MRTRKPTLDRSRSATLLVACAVLIPPVLAACGAADSGAGESEAAATSSASSAATSAESTTPEPTTDEPTPEPTLDTPTPEPTLEAPGPAVIPTSCDELYGPEVVTALAAQNFIPTIRGDAGSMGIYTQDTPANQIASDRFDFLCGLAVNGASGEALRTQVVTGLPEEERAHVLSILPAEGFSCAEVVAGQLCTSDTTSHFLRDDVWFSSEWTYAPEGYEEMLVAQIWAAR